MDESQRAVILQYFKSSGKWYGEGRYISAKSILSEIWEEVTIMLDSGKRPGLCDGANEFYVVIDVPNHPHNYPHLILPRCWERLNGT